MLKSILIRASLMGLSCLWAASTGQSSGSISDRPYLAIQKLQPRLSKDKARKLARAFAKTASESDCRIPWEILVSIAFNESSLGLQLVNHSTKDYGIMQINKRNILRHGLSQDKVIKDADYSIKFACKLLRENHDRYSSRYSHWLGFYRSGVALSKPSIHSNAKRYDKIIRTTAQSIGFEVENEQIFIAGQSHKNSKVHKASNRAQVSNIDRRSK